MEINETWKSGYEAAKADIINLVVNLESEEGSILSGAKVLLKYQINELNPEAL